MSGQLTGEGVRLPGEDGAWLKWHKLRRHGDEAPFLRHNLARGIALGASMEVDISLLACGNFVCLHDEYLDEETTGSGPVRALDAAAMGRLHMRAPDGTPTQSPPLLLSEVVELMAVADRPAAAAPVQLDMKVPGDALTGAVCDRFATVVAPAAPNLLLSAYDWPAVKRLGGGVAGLGLGYDPSEDAAKWDFAEPGAAPAFCRFIAQHAPDAAMIYLYYRLVGDLLSAGFDIIAALHRFGFKIDCWTLDDGNPDTPQGLRQCLSLGADQITTNTPIALEKRAAELSKTA